MSDRERDALLMLTLTPGLGPVLTRRALDALGSAPAVLDASMRELASIEGIGSRTAERLRRSLDDTLGGDKLVREQELIEAHQVHLVSFTDSDYPALLKHISDPPVVLYVRGHIRPDDALALAIVGSRKCTAYGREQADRLAALCVESGLVIVSGGAFGVDAAAHRAALRVRGRTIAVVGSGLAKPYPDKNADIFNQIVQCDAGAVVSELPMSTPPAPENFPARNRIISGMSLGVLVIEAALRSGALITARLAAEEHGREVMALPGRVDSPASAGCHKIIREGWATLVTTANEVMDNLGEAGRQLLRVAAANPSAPAAATEPNLFERNLTDTQRNIVSALSDQRSFDQLVDHTQLPAATIQADLTMLQIRGLIARDNGLFRRTH